MSPIFRFLSANDLQQECLKLNTLPVLVDFQKEVPNEIKVAIKWKKCMNGDKQI